MAKSTRRTHSAVFKAHVALAALSGDKTLAALAQQFDGQPHQITERKRPLSERAADLFVGGAAAAITSGFKGVLGTHILFIDFSHTMVIEVGPGANTTQTHNTNAAAQTGQVKLIY